MLLQRITYYILCVLLFKRARARLGSKQKKNPITFSMIERFRDARGGYEKWIM